MLCFLIWIIGIVNIGINVSVISQFATSLEMISKNQTYNGFAQTFDSLRIQCIINIFVTIIFCLAITIAYERSASNKKMIDNITKYLISKEKKEKEKVNKEEKTANEVNVIKTSKEEQLIPKNEPCDNDKNTACKNE